MFTSSWAEDMMGAPDYDASRGLGGSGGGGKPLKWVPGYSEWHVSEAIKCGSSTLLSASVLPLWFCVLDLAMLIWRANITITLKSPITRFTISLLWLNLHTSTAASYHNSLVDSGVEYSNPQTEIFHWSCCLNLVTCCCCIYKWLYSCDSLCCFKQTDWLLISSEIKWFNFSV